jgi:hypothetical protein
MIEKMLRDSLKEFELLTKAKEEIEALILSASSEVRPKVDSEVQPKKVDI